jgi:hypothetical protein
MIDTILSAAAFFIVLNNASISDFNCFDICCQDVTFNNSLSILHSDDCADLTPSTSDSLATDVGSMDFNRATIFT